jgi:two-component system, chemotaxis family, chemotaxis protein CheY
MMLDWETILPYTPNTTPKRMLIVDDDSETRRLYRFLFSSSGYSVEEAEDGIAALHKLAEQPNIPLVITDMNMPQMDGIELIKAIRASYPNTYLILVTAFGTTEMAKAAHKAGANEYLAKPFDFEELERRVHTFFQLPQQPSQLPG